MIKNNFEIDVQIKCLERHNLKDSILQMGGARNKEREKKRCFMTI